LHEILFSSKTTAGTTVGISKQQVKKHVFLRGEAVACLSFKPRRANQEDPPDWLFYWESREFRIFLLLQQRRRT
jgi:hypothetical protein